MHVLCLLALTAAASRDKKRPDHKDFCLATPLRDSIEGFEQVAHVARLLHNSDIEVIYEYIYAYISIYYVFLLYIMFNITQFYQIRVVCGYPKRFSDRKLP